MAARARHSEGREHACPLTHEANGLCSAGAHEAQPWRVSNDGDGGSTDRAQERTFPVRRAVGQAFARPWVAFAFRRRAATAACVRRLTPNRMLRIMWRGSDLEEIGKEPRQRQR